MSNIREAVRGFIDNMNANGEPIPHDIDIIGNIELNAQASLYFWKRYVETPF